jgi:hypothetical protein
MMDFVLDIAGSRICHEGHHLERELLLLVHWEVHDPIAYHGKRKHGIGQGLCSQLGCISHSSKLHKFPFFLFTLILQLVCVVERDMLHIRISLEANDRDVL